MKGKVFFLLSLFFPLYGVPPLDMVDTPTALTLYRGSYHISFWSYTNGGIFSRIVVGLWDIFFLGASLNVDQAIGNEPVRWNPPGPSLRLLLTRGWQEMPIYIAIGYGAFSIDILQRNSSPIKYGPYVVFTKPIFLWGEEQHIHWGIRVPTQPKYSPQDTEFFLSMDFPLGYFMPIIEISQVYFNKDRLKEISFNFGFRFLLGAYSALEIDLLTSPKKRASRILSLEFTGDL